MVVDKHKECCWSVLEGWSWSKAQLLWPIYPCHRSRGCGGGLDELARQSMKQGERVCVTGVRVEDEMDESDEKQMEGVHVFNFFSQETIRL